MMERAAEDPRHPITDVARTPIVAGPDLEKPVAMSKGDGAATGLEQEPHAWTDIRESAERLRAATENMTPRQLEAAHYRRGRARRRRAEGARTADQRRRPVPTGFPLTFS